MEVILIRHFKTKGNLEKRYIGRTDEPLDRMAIPQRMQELKTERVIVSPMKRCRQTAEILFPGQTQTVCDSLRECDFGEFEGKNYLELSANPLYQGWIDSGGTMPFPGGESHDEFRKRCVQGFEHMMDQLEKDACKNAAFVVHGGTIMSIRETFDPEHREFYHWQAANGEGFRIKIPDEAWKSGRKYFAEIEKL